MARHSVDPTSVDEAESARRGAAGPPGWTELPGGWALQIGPFAALAAAALYLRSRWASLPQRFPIHWGLDGRPNGWANRNLAGVFGPLLISAVVAGSMLLLAALLRRQPHRFRFTDPSAAAERRYRRAMLWALLATEYLQVLVCIWVSLLPLAAAAPGGTAGPPRIAPVIGLILAFVVVVTVILARIGRGQGIRPADGAPESCWKGGLFYVNPDDPSILVPKRIGIGFTLNFAHPMSWLILGLSILGPLAVALWIVHAAS